jgi:8-oxo-dGTP diphosphatase
VSSSPRHPTLVVAALVGTADGRVLLTLRRPDQPLANQWELPGGKMEAGEAPEQALVRELREEIDARVEVGPIWDAVHVPDREQPVLILVYACRLPPGEHPRCVQVADLAWVAPDELDRYDIIAADRAMLDRLRDEGPPRFCTVPTGGLQVAGGPGHLTSSGRKP